jgi:RNA polymerase sigma-70 factor (ECF subfamily)
MQVPMDQRSDEELLLGSLKGRSGDFKLLLERYEGELFNFLYRCTGDRQVSEDLFQETFLQVYAKMDIFRPEGRFRPWVYTIAANLARDAMRKQRRRRALSLEAEIRSGEGAKLGDFIEGATPAPDQLLDREESISLARELLDDLPETLREVVTLYFFNDMKYTEISEVLGLPLGTVKSRLFRAVRQMAAALRQKRGF